MIYMYVHMYIFYVRECVGVPAIVERACMQHNVWFGDLVVHGLMNSSAIIFVLKVGRRCQLFQLF